MTNPNDNTASVYDIVNMPLKGKEVTDEEVELIARLTPEKGAILDVGCGTGRHAAELVKKGYEITAVDSSSKMLEVLKSKTQKLRIIEGDIYTINLEPASFNMIILMWNTFNELALTRKDALRILAYFKTLLKAEGRILINIDNSDNLDLKNLCFETTQQEGDLTYEQHWEVVEFDAKTNTTSSKETVTIENRLGQKNAQFVSYIKQRWWRLADLQKIAKNAELKIEIKKIKYNEELYILLSR